MSRRTRRASLATRAADWRWSSVHAHLRRFDDGITAREPVIARYLDFAEPLAAGEDVERLIRLRKAEQIGRPISDAAFLDRLKNEAGRSLKPAGPTSNRDERAATGIRDQGLQHSCGSTLNCSALPKLQKDYYPYRLLLLGKITRDIADSTGCFIENPHARPERPGA